jgi:hypothetical protein
MNVSIAGDRLYSISLRPHELAELGGDVRVSMRYTPVADDDAPALRHFKLLVVELSAATTDAEGAPVELQLLKCGWELEVVCDAPCAPSQLPELVGEVPLLLGRIAAAVNDLAGRAGAGELLTDVDIAALAADFRRRGV